jgi:acyl-CoA hydrolase
VALEREALLISADDRYFRKAAHLGAIVALEAWEPAATG